MRPDISIAIWSSELSYKAAVEASELKLLHFDAKYSVDRLSQLFDSSSSLNQRVSFKRTDLLKMHVYKDAIKRTEGAYIIYPGTNTGSSGEYALWQQYHEIIPGLGAFVVQPNSKQKASECPSSGILGQMAA